MTTVTKLLAQKQLLLERLQDQLGPNERDETERLLAEVNAALDVFDEDAPQRSAERR